MQFSVDQSGLSALTGVWWRQYRERLRLRQRFGFHMQVHTDSVNVRTKITGVAPDCPRGKSEEHFQQSAPDSPLHAPWPLQVL